MWNSCTSAFSNTGMGRARMKYDKETDEKCKQRDATKELEGERTKETNECTLVRVTSHVTISPKIHCKQTMK